MPPPATPLRAATATALRPTESTDPHVLAVDLGTGGPKVAVLAPPAASGPTPSRRSELIYRGRGSRAVPAGLVGRHRGVGPGGPGRERRGARATSSASAAPPQWSGTVPVDDSGTAIGPAISWMDSRGARAVRDTVRGALNVQGYSASKLASWVRRTGGIPSLSGKDPVGHIHFLRDQRPEVYAATAVFLEPVDYLNLRLTGLARASHDSITLHWVTDNRDINAIAYDDALIEPGRPGACQAARPRADGERARRAGSRGRRRARAPGGHTRHRRHGGPALGCRGVGRRGRLRRPPLHRHLELGQLPRPLQEDRRTDQHRVHPLGDPRPLPGGRRARDGGRLPDLAARQPAVPRRRAVATSRRRRRRPTNFFGVLNDEAAAVPVGSHGVLFTPWLNGERSPVDDHTIRGGFHNISLSSTRADMVRAVFEGVALNSAWLLGAVEKYCKRSFPSLAFVGGGANSDLWSQIHADATGRTIRQIEDPVLANVRGAGLLTLLALGYLTIDDIPGTVTVKATYEPDPVASAVYASLLKEFVNLYEKTKAIHKRLNGGRLHSHS